MGFLRFTAHHSQLYAALNYITALYMLKLPLCICICKNPARKLELLIGMIFK
jgi:hypothetical protein